MDLGSLLMDPDFPDKAEEAERLLQSAVKHFIELQAVHEGAALHLARSKKSLGEGLSQLNGLQEAGAVLVEALLIVRPLLAEQPDSVTLHLERGEILSALSSVCERQEDRLQSLRRAISSHQAALKLQPGNRRARAGLCKDYFTLADLLLGDTEKAQEAWANSIRYAQGLVDDFPNVPGYQSELAIPLYNLAHTLEKSGRSEESEKYYRQALPLFDDLVKKHPQKRSYRHTRARTRYNLGMRLVMSQRRDEARQLWQAALSDYMELASRFPKSPLQSEFQSRIGATLNGLGILADAPNEALELYERAIKHQLIALGHTPKYERCGEFLGQHYNNLARAHLDLGDHRLAAEAAAQLVTADKASRHRKAATILTQCAQMVAKDDRLDSDEKAELINSYADRATDYAVQHFQECIKETDDPKEHLRAAKSCWPIFLANYELGRFEATSSLCKQTIETLRGLANRCPDVSEYERALADGHYRTAFFHFAMGHAEEAEVNYQSALRVSESLVRPFPDSVEDQKALAGTLNDLAVFYRRADRLDDAERMLRRLLALGDELPDDARDTADYFCDRGGALHNLANVHIGRGDYDTFCQLMREAVECQQRALARQPNHAEAIEFLQNHFIGLTTIHIEERQYQLAANGLGSEFFLLAMSHWQLDERDQALNWFDKAVKWIEENQPEDEEIDRFLAEADELLGIAERKSAERQRAGDSGDPADQSQPPAPGDEANADANE